MKKVYLVYWYDPFASCEPHSVWSDASDAWKEAARLTRIVEDATGAPMDVGVGYGVIEYVVDSGERGLTL